YGYLWWLGQLAGQKVFFALGYGGQYIVCVPDLDLIITATSDPNALPNDSDPRERAVMKLISDYIIPSAGN
ncbi:MAG: hypothetical protein WC061_06055, partial [Melioribacteraceae bacterium]